MNENRIIEIFNVLPTASLVLNTDSPDFTIKFVNEAYLEITGASAKDLLGKSIFEAFPANPLEKGEDKKQLLSALQKVLETRQKHKMEILKYDIQSEESNQIEQYYWQPESIPVLDEDHKVEYILHTVTDVTSQVMREADNRLFLNNTDENFILVGKDLKIINFSQRFESNFELIYKNKIKRGASIFDYVLSERKKSVKRNYLKVLAGNKIEDTLKLPLKNGEYKIFKIKYSPAVGADNKIFGVFASFLDITQEHIIRENLKVSEARYRALVENGNDVVIVLTAEGKPSYVSPSITNVLGYEIEEGYNLDVFSVVHPDDIAHVTIELQQALEKPGVPIFVTPARMRHKDGSWRWFDGTITNMMHDPAINGIVDNFREITQKIEAQKAHEFERRNKEALINTTQDLIWSVDKNLKLIAANEAALVSMKQNIGKNMKAGKFILGGSLANLPYRNEWEANYKKALAGELFQVETHEPSANTENYNWFETSFNPIYDGDEVVGVACYARNITENKITHQKLKEADQKLRNIVEHSTNMFYQHDLEGYFTYLSPQCEAFLGYDLTDGLQGWQNFTTNHPYNKIAEEYTLKAIDTGKRQPSYELQLKKANGDKIWVEVNEAPLLKNGKTVAIVGSLTNITQRKDYEAKLQETLERYNIVAKATSDTIWDLNIDNDKMLYNVNIYNMFGYHKTEVENIGSWWRDKIHPDDINLVNEILFNILNGNKKRFQLAYRFKAADGSYKYIYDRAFVLKDETGKPVRMIGAMQDVTDQKLKEREIQDSLKEKETLLAEIHHRVKNNLAVVSGMMQLQVFDTENKDLQEKLIDSVSRIQTMGTVHELLYQSNSFSRLEFSESLKKLLDNITGTMQTSVKVDIQYDCDPLKLNINQAIPVSLIVNEVATNIFKYAFVGRTKGTIIAKVLKDNDDIMLSISDNGVGLPADFDELETKSLGIKLIKVLTKQLEGDYFYTSNDSGTQFTLKFNRIN